MLILNAFTRAGFALLLWLDSVVYSFIAWLYRVFLLLAKANIFSADDYNQLASRLYAIVGVVMLFVLAYSLLRAIVNPDEITKGDTSPGKFIINVIITIAIIALVPTVFDYAHRLQVVVLKDNVIGNIILGSTNTGNSDETIKKAGYKMAGTVLSAFITPVDNAENEHIKLKKGGMTFYSNCNDQGCQNDGDFTEGQWCLSYYVSQREGGSCQENRGLLENIQESGYFSRIIKLAYPIDEDQIDYQLIISTLAGAFLLYVIFSYCLDLGIRVVKLALYQIIAPVAAIARIIPGKKGESIFSNWLKATLTTYMEVFIRVAAMYFGIYLMETFINAYSTSDIFNVGSIGIGSPLFMPALVAKILIVMGIVACIRMIPKLISDVTGIDSGNMKLGIRDKLQAGGLFAATTAARTGFESGFRNFNRTEGGIGRKLLSAAGGIGSGVKNGLIQGDKVKSWGDVNKAYKDSLNNVEAKRKEHEDRRLRYFANGQNAFTGRVSDFKNNWRDKLGFKGLDDLKAENVRIEEHKGFQKAYKDAVSSYIDKEVDGREKNGLINGNALLDRHGRVLNGDYLASLKDNMVATQGTAGYLAAKQAYDECRSDYIKAVKESVSGMGKADWDAFVQSDKKTAAKLMDSRIASDNLLNDMRKNSQRDMDSELYNTHGIDVDADLNVDTGWDPNDAKFGKLESDYTVQHGLNKGEINKRENQQEDKKDK